MSQSIINKEQASMSFKSNRRKSIEDLELRVPPPMEDPPQRPSEYSDSQTQSDATLGYI
jgi:hypothetical protein